MTWKMEKRRSRSSGKRCQEIYKKVTKGETEEKFQIGGQSYSKKEWEKLLEEFDDAQDEVKEEQEERLEKLLEEEKKKKLLENSRLLKRRKKTNWRNT